ncbi:anti-sigma factor domain-containing protein [Radiobacillus sp. PE A8.2]|uniref:anti-sigma factor domain-containing protein n=1 Tax=Radiobacillus sp. PE A8.2 TaxID=3380349 RepID=UPI003890B7E7
MRHVNCELLIDYFNGELDDVTFKKYEEHLEQCESCKEELAELHSLTADLPYASEPITPPSGMKDRILDNVFSTETESSKTFDDKQEKPKKKVIQSKKSWVTPLLAASLLFSLIGNGFQLFNNESPSPEDSILTESTDQLFKTVRLNPSDTVNSEAVASMIEKDNRMDLVVQASALQALEGTQTYQVWLLEDGKPYRAGTFVPNQDGVGAVSYTVDYAGEHQWDTVAITLEPTADSELPQGDIILSSEL